MSRAKGSKNKATLAKQAVMLLAPPIVADTRTDAQILTDIKERFDIYYRMIQGATEQDSINALIVSGSAYIGRIKAMR